MEYASQVGGINTDFPDNVGGVDCSDNEVNIKILPQPICWQPAPPIPSKRNQMLYAEMTDAVAQSSSPTPTVSPSPSLGHRLPAAPSSSRSNRASSRAGARRQSWTVPWSSLPSDEGELSERMAAGQGLTRPGKLAVLVAYGKMVLKAAQLPGSD